MDLDFGVPGRPPRILSVTPGSSIAMQGCQVGDLLVGSSGPSGRELRSAGSVSQAAELLKEANSLTLKRQAPVAPCGAGPNNGMTMPAVPPPLRAPPPPQLPGV